MKSLLLILTFTFTSFFSSNDNIDLSYNEDLTPPCIPVTLSCGESGCYQTTEGETLEHIIDNIIAIDEEVCG